MAYTPELSYESSCTLRRIAWALELPMTIAIDRVFEEIINHFDSEKVCSSCRDKTKCKSCNFNHQKKNFELLQPGNIYEIESAEGGETE